MNLPSSCNSVSCADQIEMPHKGICPQGFHIPTNDEWDKLYRYVGIMTDNHVCITASGESFDCYKSQASKYLKAHKGWNDCGPNPPEGIKNHLYSCEDSFGFSALPGGYYYDGPYGNAGSNAGNFDGAGSYGYWWSADEFDADADSTAYRQIMYNYGNYVDWAGRDKPGGYSVRCIKD
jgi:uncharacterized protein (TIGR02145 family)